MTTILRKRTIFDAVIFEPLDLIVAQPPQIFISAASAYLIAAEAAVLLPTPINILLAIGAEWGYLRGMASSANVDTRWKDRLTYANGALVVLYGALFSLRKFGALPSVDAYESGAVATGVLGAVIMTAIHIACIGAVTICAMMAHSAMLAHEARVKRSEEEERNQRNRAQLADEDARNQEWRRAQLEIEIEKQRQHAQLQIETERAKARAELRAATRNATAAQVAPQPKRNPVIVDGQEFASIQAAADHYGITRQAMSKRLKREA